MTSNILGVEEQTLDFENVLDSEFHSENFWILDFISKFKIHYMNEFQKREVLANRTNLYY